MKATTLASAAHLPAPWGLALPEGTVRVSVPVAAAREAVWTALTERDAVGRWSGNLSEPFAPDGAYRLDFGDGAHTGWQAVSQRDSDQAGSASAR
jgi:uncharacterized protein YndB with AHSA1/START domain